MRIALAQQNYIIGDFEHNYRKMASAIDEAVSASADLVVFPELAVCGYPPRDFLEFRDFVDRSQRVVEDLAKHAGSRIAVIVGAPTVNPELEGKDLFNSAYFLRDGNITDAAHKTLLPTYDIFDEYRYFEPVSDYRVIEFKGKKIALTICEDIWNIANENPLYKICPMDEMIGQKPDLMINISASPFSYKQADVRTGIVKANAERYKLPVFYCNHIGAQTEILFDGGSLVVSPDAVVFDEMPYFEEAVTVYDLDEVVGNASGSDRIRPRKRMDLIHRGLVTGVRDYFRKLGFQKAILGLSGGIDSALTLAVAAEALGPKHVLAVMMPSKFSSDHSVSDSEQLVKNLGCSSKLIPIKEVYDAFLKALEPHFDGKPFGLAEENIQSRARAVYLMALSNKHGHILLNTSNKSEAAVGYGTLYGDMCGGLSVIGDLYKTQVFELAKYLNERAGYEMIPGNILTKPPSAELRPDQKDSDSLPEYDVLDEVLYEYIEKRLGPDEIIANGFDRDLVHRVLKLVNRNEFKRYQTPPMIRISPKAFGMGRRMPIVGKYLE